MPLTGYLKIGDIPGESQRVDHEDEIDIFDLSWGMEQRRTAMTGRGRARARADVGPISVKKRYDASSPYLAEAVATGKSFRDMVLFVRKDSGEAHLDYLVITMENVIVTAYDMGGASDDASDVIEEEIEIDFEAVTIKYTRTADDFSALGTHEVRLRG